SLPENLPEVLFLQIEEVLRLPLGVHEVQVRVVLLLRKVVDDVRRPAEALAELHLQVDVRNRLVAAQGGLEDRLYVVSYFFSPPRWPLGSRAGCRPGRPPGRCSRALGGCPATRGWGSVRPRRSSPSRSCTGASPRWRPSSWSP